jgi:hypothetical protein
MSDAASNFGGFTDISDDVSLFSQMEGTDTTTTTGLKQLSHSEKSSLSKIYPTKISNSS